MWQLDVEGKRNEGVAPGTWRTFIADFMEAALRDLGAFGFLYIGFPFYQSIYGASDLDTLRQFNWWLPAYGKNDGAVHAFKSNVPSQLVVIHQFTSAGHLDPTAWSISASGRRSPARHRPRHRQVTRRSST